MLRCFVGLISVLCAAGCASHPGPRPLSPLRPHPQTHVQQRGWHQVSPPGTGVSFRIPGYPQLQQRSTAERDGTLVQINSALVEGAHGLFGVVVAEFERAIVGDPTEFAYGLALELPGRRELQPGRSRRLNVPGFYARELVSRPTNRGDTEMRIRFVLGLRRLYIAVSVVPAAPSYLTVAEQFLSSLQIEPSDSLYPQVADGAVGAWSSIYVPEDAFAIRMPAISNVRYEQVSLATDQVHMRIFEGRNETGAFRVRVGAALEDYGLLEDVVRELNLGTVTGPAQASGFPGLSFRHASGTGRVFRTHGRIYVIEATESAQTDEFFASLRIL